MNPALRNGMKVPRGSARALRRRDMVTFRAKQRARAKLNTGVICVNAPSLGMLKQYIGKLGEGT